jgi:Serine/threonine protein phosphatase
MLIKSDLNCDIGCVRPKNEDIILLGGELFRDKSQTSYFEIGENTRFAAIVADGMGGHKGGEIASEDAAQFFCDFTLSLENDLSAAEIIEKIKNWANIAHQNILNKGRENPEYNGMGSTFCGMLFYENQVFSLNIGDSRLYRFRNEILRQISIDHSMREHTGDMSLPSNLIYNSLGAGENTFVDVKELTGQLYDDDLFLVCSDGICDMISDEEIEEILSKEPTAGKLVEAARNAGGKDNISAILLKIKEI